MVTTASPKELELRPLLLSTEDGFAAAFQKCLGVHLPKDVEEARDDPGPSGLLTGADAVTVVAVEIFVKQQMVTPIGIALEFLGSAKNRTPASFVAEENPGQPIGDFASDLEKVHQLAGASWALDFEFVAVNGPDHG